MTKQDTSNNEVFELPADWRGEVMAKIRTLIHQADPEMIEEVQYKTTSNPNGVLVWYHEGMISTGEVYKQHLRISLSKGNVLKDQDPKGLINSYRAILIHEEDKIDETAFKNLIRAAVELNIKSKKK
jgi:hypothetical protein